MAEGIKNCTTVFFIIGELHKNTTIATKFPAIFAKILLKLYHFYMIHDILKIIICSYQLSCYGIFFFYS